MSQTLTHNRVFSVYVCYHCSSCHTPVVTAFPLLGSITNSGYAVDKIGTGGILNTEALTYIDEIRNEVQTARAANTYPILQSKSTQKQLADNIRLNFSLGEADPVCPRCGAALFTIEDTTADCRSMRLHDTECSIYSTGERALLWAQHELQKKLATYDPSQIDRIAYSGQYRLSALQAELTKLNAQSPVPNLKQEYEAMERNLHDLESALSALGPLAFKQKKEYQTAIQNVTEQMGKLKANIHSETVHLAQKTAPLQIELEELCLMLKPASGGIQAIVSSASTAYCLILNAL